MPVLTAVVAGSIEWGNTLAFSFPISSFAPFAFAFSLSFGDGVELLDSGCGGREACPVVILGTPLGGLMEIPKYRFRDHLV